MSVFCSICLDTFKSEDEPNYRPVFLVPCSHVFHEECIKKYLKSCNVKRRCPLCRAGLVVNEKESYKKELRFVYSSSSVVENLLAEIKALKDEKIKLTIEAANDRRQKQEEILRLNCQLLRERDQFKKFKVQIQNATKDVLKACEGANKLM